MIEIEQLIKLDQEPSVDKFKTLTASYKLQVCNGNINTQTISEMVTCIEHLLGDEACSKSLYIHLSNFILQSDIINNDLMAVLAKYFNKIEFRYGFHLNELGKINRLM